MNMQRMLAISILAFGTAGCATGPSPAQSLSADYGPVPTSYTDAIHHYFDASLKDPGSIQYREVTVPIRGYIQGGWIVGNKITYGWRVDATINGKNSYGAYVGYKTYMFLFRGEEIVDMISPET